MKERLEITYSIFEISSEGHLVVPTMNRSWCKESEFDDTYDTEEEACQAILNHGTAYCNYYILSRCCKVNHG